MLKPFATAIDYGVDAPGLLCNTLAIGTIVATAGAGSLFFRKNRAFAAVGSLLVIGSLLPLTLGLSLTAYAIAGKRRTLVSMLNCHEWRGDEVVLDVGAGRGFLAVAAAKRVPKGRVIAIDVWRAEELSGNGPEGLLSNATAEGVRDKIEVVTGDVRSLDLADESIDVVVSLLCLHNIEPPEDRVKACLEIARVLKPGGQALIADYTATDDYARAFGEAGLLVHGPTNLIKTALSLMALVEAEKPAVR